MRHVFLVGFMAAGKTTVGRLLAERLAMPFIDLDDAVSEAAGVSVPELFTRLGEEAFRAREAEALARVAAGPPAVVATGGGAPCRPGSLELMRARGLVLALAVPLEVALARAGDPAGRPLLQRSPVELEALYRARQACYRQAHAVVATEARSPDEVAALAAQLARRADQVALAPDSVLVSLGERAYPVVIAGGALGELGALCRAALPPACSRVALVSDAHVDALHGERAARALGGAGFAVARQAVAPGEVSKGLAAFGALQNALVAAGLDRSSALVALGGGVVGDLVGFAAATLFRGIPVVQAPTTLLAMTDSAIGGKTGIDLDAGKNLVGAVWQPRLVVVDPAVLATLPPREVSAAFGELIKYALLDGEELYGEVEALAADRSDAGLMARVVRRAAAYKAWTVALDEREESGERALLNLGHTVGHAIEAAGYAGDPAGALLHGEAVGLGLLAACRVSAALGLAGAELEARVALTLQRAGLPSDLDGWLRPDVIGRIGVDKKRTGKRIRFIALERPGVPHPVSLELERLGEILAAPVAL